MKKEDKEQEKAALDYMGKAFVKVPRSVLYGVFNRNEEEKLLGKVHLALFVLCNYDNHPVKLGARLHACNRGEYVGTYRGLSNLAGVPFGSIGRLLRELMKRQLIRVVKVAGGSSIRVNGYDQFTYALQEEYEKPVMDNTPSDAASRMSEAEARIGGRSMQNRNNN